MDHINQFTSRNITNQSVKKTWLYVLLLALFLTGFILRTVNLGEFQPIAQDEKTWLMVGTSLIQTGQPTTWTIYNDAYVKAGIIPDGGTVTPYLDHPPLFSLLIGSWAHLAGMTDEASINWVKVRAPMILLSLTVILLSYFFTKTVFGPKLAIFTFVAMVFFPSHVITSRFVAVEHLIGFMLILSLYLYYLYTHSPSIKIRKITLFFLWLLCATAILYKLSAIIIPGTVVFMALFEKRYKLAATLFLGFLISNLLFFGWGYIHNWEAFLNVMKAHQNRAQTFAHFWSIITWYNIGHFTFYDPSISIGIIGAIGLGLKYKIKGKGLYMFAPLLLTSFLFLYIAPFETYGWYKYMLYPLMGIGIGHVFTELYRGRSVYFFLFLPLVAMIVQNSGIVEDHLARRVMLLAMYSLVVFSVLFKSKSVRIQTVVILLLVILCLYESIWVFNVLNAGQWTYEPL